MKYFLILLLAAQAFSLDDPSFGDWQLRSGISIDGPEKDLREQVFLAHVAEIAAHNAVPSNTYQKGLNLFSHLGAEEFVASRCKTVLPEDLVKLSSGGILRADITTKGTTTKATTTKKTTTTKSTTSRTTPTTRTTTTKTKTTKAPTTTRTTTTKITTSRTTPTTKTTTKPTTRTTPTKPTTPTKSTSSTRSASTRPSTVSSTASTTPSTTTPTTPSTISTTTFVDTTTSMTGSYSDSSTIPTTTVTDGTTSGSTESSTGSSTITSTSGTTAKPAGYPFGSYTPENAPASVDYSYLMTPPQNQGGCGSCWAFGALAQLEAMMKIKDSSYNTVLGPQYLVDCDKTNGGCNGGWPRKAMEWIRVNGSNSAPSMTDYPYTAKDESCKTPSMLPLNIKSVNQKYFSGNEASLKAQIANYGPAVVAIQVTGNFQSYQGGVFYDATCPSGTASCSTVNHAVVVTGYGTDPVNGDYWMVKNSWSDNWGEKGYIRMARNKDNNCNIACWAIWSM